MTTPLIPSVGTPLEFASDWGKTARLIVHDSLKTEPGEKVIIHADPSYFPELTEQVRIELVRAGAVELSVSMVNSGALETVLHTGPPLSPRSFHGRRGVSLPLV